MLKRLFEIDDPSANPRIDSTVNDGNQSQKVYYFLTREDRAMIGEAYEYAEANGLDPFQVDNLAFDLGLYRKHQSPGAGKLFDSTGNLFHVDGRPFVAIFPPEGEAAVRDILSSKALDDTRIDYGFLQQVTNPGFSPKPAVNFGALRELVFAFSPSHSNGELKSDVSFAERDARIELANVIEASAPLFAKNVSTNMKDIDGKSIMMSRLFGEGESDSAVDGAKRPRFTKYLSDDDKELLGGLYAYAKASGADMAEIDKMADALGALRKAESLMKLQNELGPAVAPFLLGAEEPHQNAYDAGKFRDVTGRAREPSALSSKPHA